VGAVKDMVRWEESGVVQCHGATNANGNHAGSFTAGKGPLAGKQQEEAGRAGETLVGWKESRPVCSRSARSNGVNAA